MLPKGKVRGCVALLSPCSRFKPNLFTRLPLVMATLALNLELIATAHELVRKVSSVMFAL